MSDLGDYRTTQTVYGMFTTVDTTGAPTTLAGTPKLRCYKSGSTTESSDITPTADFDSRTGLNAFSVDLTGDSGFYATAKDYQVVVTAGTVGGASIVGYVVASFSVENRSALRPATISRNLVVDASGLADANAVKVGPTGSGTAQTARDLGTSVLLSSGTGTGQLDFTSGVVKANATQIAGSAVSTSTAQLGVNVVNFGGSAGAFASGRPAVNTTYIAGSVVDTATAQIGTNVVTMAASTLTSSALAASAATEISGAVWADLALTQAIEDAVWDAPVASHLDTGSTGKTLNTASSAGDPLSASVPGVYSAGTAGYLIGTNLNATVSSRSTYAGGAVASVTGAVGSVTGNVGGNVTGSVGSVVGNVGGNVTGSVASVAGAVGSVTGAVGSVTTPVVVASGTVTTVTDLTTTANAEPTSVPAANATLAAKIGWLYVLARNKILQTSTTQTLKANDGSTTIATAAVSDDSTTTERSKFT